jgi:hypothetical protein
MPLPRSLLALATAALLAVPGAGAVGQSLERDWCTGVSPITWGFTVTPPETCHEIRLRAVSPSVRLLDVSGGPGLPQGWEVERVGDAEAVARGPSAVRAGQRLASFFVVRTNRSTAAIDSRGAEPVEWELSLADARGVGLAVEPQRASFPPVIDLTDAVSRGLVLATVEPLGPSGPVELTIDNPTWRPIWLDLPPGLVLSDSSGTDWVVGLTRPFRMMRKQKTGRTVHAFPLSPRSPETQRPRRLQLSNRIHDSSALIAGLSLAVRELERRSSDGARRPGAFEALEPFEFWPMVFRWAVWQETVRPDAAVLEGMVRDLLESRARAGDRHAARIDAAEAADEIEQARREALDLQAIASVAGLPLDLEASRARFR